MSGAATVAEEVASAKAVAALAKKLNVEMPICEAVYEVLYGGRSVGDALKGLVERPLTTE